MKTQKILSGFAVLSFVATIGFAVHAEAPALPMASPSVAATTPSGVPVRSNVAAIPSPAPDLFTRAVQPPDVNSIPVLANMIKAGSKLYFLGQRSGLNGWLIVQDGQVQMIYLTTDNKTAIVGGMFTADGDNVTSPQVEELSKQNKEIEALVYGPGGKAAAQNANAATPTAPATTNSPTPVPTQAEAAKPPVENAAASLSPGERLIQDLQNAAGVEVGNNDKAKLLMVIDPNCPHCQATWRELRDSVFANKLQVRLVPIGNISPESTRAAAQLLQAINPLDAWDKYVSGDKKQLDGIPEPVRVGAINSNRDLIEKWNIRATPYLVYRGKDGKVKIVQGKPERMAAVLADLVQ